MLFESKRLKFRSFSIEDKIDLIKILNDEVIGKEATRLYKDAKAMLSKIINEKWRRKIYEFLNNIKRIIFKIKAII